MYCSYIWLDVDFDFSVFPQVLSKVVSSELDPLIGVWEIGSGSALGCPIILLFCVDLPKMSYNKVLVLVLVDCVSCGL